MKKLKHKLHPTSINRRDRVAKKSRSTKQGVKKTSRSKSTKKSQKIELGTITDTWIIKGVMEFQTIVGELQQPVHTS